MQTKLQELTEKIYQEGVNKARQESEMILSQARKQADELLASAQKQAGDIVKQAEKQAEELSRNTLNEMQLTARQAVSELKQKVVNLIEARTITPETKAAFSQEGFTQDIIMTIVNNWNPSDSANVDLSLLLPAHKQKEFEAFFSKKAKDLMKKGLEVDYSSRIKGGFKIGPKDQGYMISFTDEDFDNFFRSFMRPRLIQMLYAQEK